MLNVPEKTLLDITLEAAAEEEASVTEDGVPLAPQIHGSIEHKTVTHVDDRGTVTELWDDRWNFHPEPVTFAYTYTVREGRAKGWGLHKLHEDRYFLLDGRMEIVCYDVRPDSPTCGQISKIRLSPENPRMVTIPTHVWHANINIGAGSVRVINFPTMPYDHANPDKYRLPLRNDVIPYEIDPSIIGW
ncbi:MAG: dTDP-4-dehydrorhamnose 3,5-epimerase family protein [Pseudomonadota bacterium]